MIVLIIIIDGVAGIVLIDVFVGIIVNMTIIVMLSCRHRHSRLHWHDSNPHACHSTSRTIMGVRCGDAHMRAPEEPQAKKPCVHWACAENGALSGSKRTSRTIIGACCRDACTGGAPGSGPGLRWACAENGRLCGLKCTFRTIIGMCCGDTCTGGAPGNGPGVHWACAENVSFSR